MISFQWAFQLMLLILPSRALNGLILGSFPDGNFYIISDYKDSGWYVGMKPTGYD